MMFLQVNVTLFAHESATKFSSLKHADLNVPLGHFFKTEFSKKKIGGKRNLENREIDIRFTYDREAVVSFPTVDCLSLSMYSPQP